MGATASPDHGADLATTSRWVRRADDVLVVAIVIALALSSARSMDAEHAWLVYGVEVASASSLLLRRKLPWVVLPVTVAAYVLVSLLGGHALFTVIPAALCVWSIGRAQTPLLTVFAALGGGSVMLTAAWLSGGGPLTDQTVLVVLALGFAAATGVAAYHRRRSEWLVTTFVDRARATLRGEVDRLATQERHDLARHLHDAVAHHHAVIRDNAVIAARTIEERPDVAKVALAAVEAATDAVVSETAALLDTLRPLDTPASTPSASPTLNSHLPALLDSFKGIGLTVAVDVDGELGTIDPAVGAVAYRVVQEALANAHKHGVGSSAHLALTVTITRVQVSVTNLASPAPHRPDRHGLLGVRERIASVNGTMRIERPPHSYRLIADLPAVHARTRA